jgi:hypothetical protein
MILTPGDMCMVRRLAAITALAVAVTACTAPPTSTARDRQAGPPGNPVPGRSTARPQSGATRVPAGPPEGQSAATLLKVATVFNREYDSGDYGPAYDRWDSRSQAVITRAGYIQRRTECRALSTASVVESARPGPHGAWLVDYEIAGNQLVDYWFYVHGRWVFDLVLSNPSAVQLYRLSPQRYAVAAGCSH